jgi:hypothetical protein
MKNEDMSIIGETVYLVLDKLSPIIILKIP